MNAIDLQAARRALASCRVDGIEAPLGEWAELAALEAKLAKARDLKQNGPSSPRWSGAATS